VLARDITITFHYMLDQVQSVQDHATAGRSPNAILGLYQIYGDHETVHITVSGFPMRQNFV
jgi:hypothetical protein